MSKEFNSKNTQYHVPKRESIHEPTPEVVSESVVKRPPRKGAVQNCHGVNVRLEPHAKSEILEIAYQFTRVVVVDEIGDYYAVKVNGKEGYILKQYIQFA